MSNVQTAAGRTHGPLLAWLRLLLLLLLIHG